MKKHFLKNNLVLLFNVRGKVLNSFERRLFLIKKLDKIPTRKPTLKVVIESTPEVATENRTNTRSSNEKKKQSSSNTRSKHKISLLKFHEEFLNETENEGKNINKQIFVSVFFRVSQKCLCKIYIFLHKRPIIFLMHVKFSKQICLTIWDCIHTFSRVFQK